jgi:hypothetical protein
VAYYLLATICSPDGYSSGGLREPPPPKRVGNRDLLRMDAAYWPEAIDDDLHVSSWGRGRSVTFPKGSEHAVALCCSASTTADVKRILCLENIASNMVPTMMKLSHLSVLDTAKEFSCKCASRAGSVAV